MSGIVRSEYFHNISKLTIQAKKIAKNVLILGSEFPKGEEWRSTNKKEEETIIIISSDEEDEGTPKMTEYVNNISKPTIQAKKIRSTNKKEEETIIIISSDEEDEGKKCGPKLVKKKKIARDGPKKGRGKGPKNKQHEKAQWVSNDPLITDHIDSALTYETNFLTELLKEPDATEIKHPDPCPEVRSQFDTVQEVNESNVPVSSINRVLRNLAAQKESQQAATAVVQESVYEKIRMFNGQTASPATWSWYPGAAPGHHIPLSQPPALHLAHDKTGDLSQETSSDVNSEHNSSADEDSQLRLRLKKKLQRNRTSFTNDQIDNLEKGSASMTPTLDIFHPNLDLSAYEPLDIGPYLLDNNEYDTNTVEGKALAESINIPDLEESFVSF